MSSKFVRSTSGFGSFWEKRSPDVDKRTRTNFRLQSGSSSRSCKRGWSASGHRHCASHSTRHGQDGDDDRGSNVDVDQVREPSVQVAAVAGPVIFERDWTWSRQAVVKVRAQRHDLRLAAQPRRVGDRRLQLASVQTCFLLFVFGANYSPRSWGRFHKQNLEQHS